jgi:cell division protein FtsN
VADDKSNELIDVQRRTSLNALATIKLAPARHGTRVSVDAHYVMKFRTREFGRKVVPRFLDDSVDFGSAGDATVSEEIREGSEMKVVSIGCRPTGALERKIVSVLERPRLLVAENNASPRPAKLSEPAPAPETGVKPKPAPAPQKVTAPKKLSPQLAAAPPQPRKQLRPPRPPAPELRAQPKPRPKPELVAAPRTSPPQIAVAAPQPRKLFRPRNPPSPPAPERAAAKASSPSKAISPAKPTPATAVGTVWRVQLGALRSHSKAESAWNILQQATPDLLSKLTLRVQKVDLSKGTFFRVQAGPFADRQASVALCNQLKKRNQDCLVVAP